MPYCCATLAAFAASPLTSATGLEYLHEPNAGSIWLRDKCPKPTMAYPILLSGGMGVGTGGFSCSEGLSKDGNLIGVGLGISRVLFTCASVEPNVPSPLMMPVAIMLLPALLKNDR